jgi:hypothetical protein
MYRHVAPLGARVTGEIASRCALIAYSRYALGSNLGNGIVQADQADIGHADETA